MTTISFDENININKYHFKTLEDFQLYLIQTSQKSELSPAHKSILDSRLADAKENSESFISLDELKSSIRRRLKF